MMLVRMAGAQDASQDVPTVVDANIPPPTQWSHHLPFAELPEGIRSVAFAPDPALGVLAGKLAADLAFYAVAITGFEMLRARSPGA